MHFWFERDEYGEVVAKVEPAFGFLQTVLEDGLALDATWAFVDGPQTADITDVAQRLEHALRAGRDVKLCAGNMSFMELRDGHVFADIDYDPPEPGRGDVLDAAEVLELLEAYRREVVAVWVERLAATGRRLLPSSARRRPAGPGLAAEPEPEAVLTVGEADAELTQRLSAERDDHNRRAVDAGRLEREFTVRIDAADGELLAGLSGWTWGSAAGIEMLWVRADQRGRGHGSRLLLAAERIAWERSCVRMNVSSFTFQTPGFFTDRGYVEVGRTEDLPLPGHAEVHFAKRLR